MAKRDKDILRHLSDALGATTEPGVDYYEKVIDATAGYNRMLIGVYSLLAAGDVFLLFLVEMSPWAGAALMASWALFVVGVVHTSMHIMTYHKMLLLADAVELGAETVDLESGEEQASPEALVRAEAVAKGLHATETQYVLLGFLAAGGAVVIEHWQYAWRASAVLGGVIVALLLVATVRRAMGAVSGRSGDAAEDEPHEDASDRA